MVSRSRGPASIADISIFSCNGDPNGVVKSNGPSDIAVDFTNKEIYVAVGHSTVWILASGVGGGEGLALPSGGTENQALVKQSVADGDADWEDTAILAVADQIPAEEPIAPGLTGDVGSLAIAARADHRHPLLLDPTDLADADAAGAAITFEYASSIVFGSPVYYTSAKKVAPADASTAATAPVIGIALATASSGFHSVLVGTGVAMIRDDSHFSFSTIGGLVYLSTAVGALTQTAPVATDEVIQPIGIALDTHVLLYMTNPFFLTLT